MPQFAPGSGRATSVTHSCATSQITTQWKGCSQERKVFTNNQERRQASESKIPHGKFHNIVVERNPFFHDGNRQGIQYTSYLIWLILTCYHYTPAISLSNLCTRICKLIGRSVLQGANMGRINSNRLIVPVHFPFAICHWPTQNLAGTWMWRIWKARFSIVKLLFAWLVCGLSFPDQFWLYSDPTIVGWGIARRTTPSSLRCTHEPEKIHVVRPSIRNIREKGLIRVKNLNRQVINSLPQIALVMTWAWLMLGKSLNKQVFS